MQLSCPKQQRIKNSNIGLQYSNKNTKIISSKIALPQLVTCHENVQFPPIRETEISLQFRHKEIQHSAGCHDGHDWLPPKNLNFLNCWVCLGTGFQFSNFFHPKISFGGPPGFSGAWRQIYLSRLLGFSSLSSLSRPNFHQLVVRLVALDCSCSMVMM